MKKNFLVALSLAGALCLSAPGMEADAAWKITSSGRQYTLNNGQGYATGWKKIGNYWYFALLMQFQCQILSCIRIGSKF